MYLIFDTETTGLPKNWRAPISDTENWPRCVQLAWQVHDELGNLIESKKAKLISGFDNYERFLYYERHPYAWPKTPDFGIGNLQVTGSPLLPESLYLQVGLTDCDVFLKPYNLRPTTSSEAEEWYGSTNELNINYGG